MNMNKPGSTIRVEFPPGNVIPAVIGEYRGEDATWLISVSGSRALLSSKSKDIFIAEIAKRCSTLNEQTPNGTFVLSSGQIINYTKVKMNDTQTGASSMDSNSLSGQSRKPGSVILTDSPPLRYMGYREIVRPLEGTKNDEDKVGVQLLPPGPLEEIARVLDFGAKKYASWNWAKGIKFSRVYGAALRHLWAWYRGEDNDPETGLSHLAHAGCCVLFLLQYIRTKRSFDDRPVKELSDENA
jgi:hypothetical protein